MPLIAKFPDALADQPGQAQLDKALELICENEEREEDDSGYEVFYDVDEESVGSDTDGSFMHQSTGNMGPPIVPQRSEMRAKRILDRVMLDLKAIHRTLPVSAKDTEQLSMADDPHKSYLSSEEDASLSDYEDTDSVDDFTPIEDNFSASGSQISSRWSQRDIARIVCFTVVAKEEIVQINIPPTSSQKRHSMHLDPLTHSIIANVPTDILQRPTLNRRTISTRYVSLASTTSNTTSLYPNASLPPRESSKANLHSLAPPAKASTLAFDQYMSPRTPIGGHEDLCQPLVTPKTPTSLAAAPFKSSLGRNTIKKKAGLQKLSSSILDEKGGAVTLQLTAEECRRAKEIGVLMRAETLRTDRAKHRDIMEAARDIAPAPEVLLQIEEKRKMNMGHKISLSMGLGRRKTVKGSGDRYLS